MNYFEVLVIVAGFVVQNNAFPAAQNGNNNNGFGGPVPPPWAGRPEGRPLPPMSFAPDGLSGQVTPGLQALDSSSTPVPPTSSGLSPPPRSSQTVINQVPCPCPFTREYNPVCGSDGQTYSNQAILNCYRTCGFEVTVTRLQACVQTAGRTRVD